MAGIAKVDTDGVLSGPLRDKEIGYSTSTEEMYVGTGTGDGTFGSEYRVTRNAEVSDHETRLQDIEDNTTLAEYGIVDAYTKAEIDVPVNKNTAVTGTATENRYDKILSTLEVISMDYTSGELDYIRYIGDDDATVYYRDVMTYTDGNLVRIDHFYGTSDLVTVTASTELTYDVNDNLVTVTYTE